MDGVVMGNAIVVNMHQSVSKESVIVQRYKDYRRRKKYDHKYNGQSSLEWNRH